MTCLSHLHYVGASPVNCPAITAIADLCRAVTAAERCRFKDLDEKVVAVVTTLGGADRRKIADHLSYMAKAARVGEALRRLTQAGELTVTRDSTGQRIYCRAEGPEAKPGVA